MIARDRLRFSAIGLFSVASLLALAYLVGGFNESLARVVRFDYVALGLLAVGGALLWLRVDR